MPVYTVDMLRTAAQRRALCRDCPVARTADLVGDTPSLLIIRDLMTGPQRFGALEESLKGISTRTLTNKLKMLESKKIIACTPRGYALTSKGRALQPIVDSMRHYGEKHL